MWFVTGFPPMTQTNFLGHPLFLKANPWNFSYVSWWGYIFLKFSFQLQVVRYVFYVNVCEYRYLISSLRMLKIINRILSGNSFSYLHTYEYRKTYHTRFFYKKPVFKKLSTIRSKILRNLEYYWKIPHFK